MTVSFNHIKTAGWGVGQKGLPTSFFSVTSTNVQIIPHNFLTFSFNSFVTLL